MKLATVGLLIAGVSTFILAGCGGGAGSGAPSFVVTAQETVNGITQNWANANIHGDAEVGTFSCSGSDTSCITQFSATTNTSGSYTVTTDALPASWDVGASPDGTCSQGASSGFVNTSSNSTLQLFCGSNNTTTNLTVSPSYCYKEINSTTNAIIANTCPTTLTLTASSGILPVSHAMTVSGYTESASALSSASITPTSSTTMVIPFPSAVSTNAPTILKVVDPSTNRVMGATTFLFDLQYYSGSGPR